MKKLNKIYNGLNFDRLNWLVIIGLMAAGFFFRIYGLKSNYSFWIDEFSTGKYSASILKGETLTNLSGLSEVRNLLNHLLTALSMKFFGINEFAARFPSVIWGTLMIPIVFLVIRQIFNQRIALSVAILTAFSAIEITWSRQARSYALFQLTFLVTAYFFWRLMEKLSATALDKKNKLKVRDIVLVIFFLLFSLLTHLLTITIVFNFLLYGVILVFLRKEKIRNFVDGLSKIVVFKILILILLIFILFWYAGIRTIFIETFINNNYSIKFHNNFWYYHSFFWRQYSLFTFLFFLGLLNSVIKKNRKTYFISSLAFVHLFVVVFLLRYLNVRYLYPVFPLIFFGYAVYFLEEISKFWWPKSSIKQSLFLFSLTGLIIINGNKFTFRPRLFYSLNADMKEIPQVDYQLVYERIKNGIEKADSPIPVVDTWADRIIWYLGTDYAKAFVIRSSDKLSYSVRYYQEVDRPAIRSIVNKEELLDLIKKNSKGYIFIDGHEVPNLPPDALSYIENNLKPELKLSRFSLDPDPYDTWPASLYSWGME